MHAPALSADSAQTVSTVAAAPMIKFSPTPPTPPQPSPPTYLTRSLCLQYYDLQMTRSIVDWKGPDVVLPHPQLLRFRVEAHSHARVVIASDGLWDVCTHVQAAKICRKREAAEAVAKGLLAVAEKEYLTVRGLEGMSDDTTVICVDLNPSLRPFSPPRSSCTVA